MKLEAADRAIGSLRRLERDLELAMRKALQEAVHEATEHARRTTLFRDHTGETRRSIIGVTQGFEGYVQAGGASIFLENGTQPHWIGANVFIGNGVGWRYIGMHPGTEPRPFMTQARDRGEQVAQFAADVFVQEAVEQYLAR